MLKLKEYLNNKVDESHDVKTYTIECVDFDNSLYELLNYIQEVAGTGHSFEVIVDPDDSETKKSFYIDGDGAFSINSLKIS